MQAPCGPHVTRRVGELTAKLSARVELETADRLVDAVRRLEAEAETLRRALLDAERAGELLGLTRALGLAHGSDIAALRKHLKTEIARLAWEGK